MSTVYTPLVSDLQFANLETPLSTDYASSVAQAGASLASFSPTSSAGETGTPGLGTTAPLSSGVLGELLSGGTPLGAAGLALSGSSAPSSLGSGIMREALSGGSPFSASRIVSIVLGLLLIGGGIIMFRPDIANEAAKAAIA